MPENESSLFRKSSLERVSSPDQLNEYIKITNPSLIVTLLGILTILIAGAVWVFAGGIPDTVDLVGTVITDSNGKNSMHCFVPIGNSKRLKEGMDVQISPDYADRSEYGYINGKITSVGDTVVTDEYLKNKFSNPQMVIAAVSTAMQHGNVVEVEMSMGDWSRDKGNSVEVTEGANCAVSVMVGETKPYQLMFKQ